MRPPPSLPPDTDAFNTTCDIELGAESLDAAADRTLNLVGLDNLHFADVPTPRDVKPAITAVVAVDESEWQLELARPARLTLVGWMVSGTMIIGNHADAAITIPENRSKPAQRFNRTDYVELFVRGRRTRLRSLSAREARLLVDDAQVESTKEAGAVIEIIRRDSAGEEDFEVVLELQRVRDLPDPRAQLLALDDSDRMAQALFTFGLPLGSARHITLGGISLSAAFDGEHLQISDYLASYRKAGSFAPFFVGGGGQAYRTAPEDGRSFTIEVGTHLIAGTAIYRFDR